MTFRFALLGIEIISVSFTIGSRAAEEEYVEGIAGGSSHNFERLPEEFDYEERNRLGFH